MKGQQQHPLDHPGTIRAWTFFDWANSAYSLVITTAIFPAYYLAVTDEEVRLGGMTVSNSALYAYAISTSYLLIALISPLLSGIADYGGQKKRFLQFFTWMGSLSCMALFFFQGMDQLLFGIGAFILGLIGFAGGLVFYNSYLPEIASPAQYDRVSARGFAMGYIGSVLQLILSLVVIQKPEWFGLEDTGSLPARLSFAMVGIWWFGFALIPFRALPSPPSLPLSKELLWKGVAELRKVAAVANRMPNLKTFLASFFFYSAGVQTVMFLAATFAEKELKLATAELILVVLIIQLVAIGGAFLFARLSERYGNKPSLLTMLLIWIAICVYAYFMQSPLEFYGVAACVGLVMGGIQSLSRSTYSKLLPASTQDTASFFSFYDVLEKVAIVLGSFTFGYLDQLTGSMRTSILVLCAFFMIGSVFLVNVQVPRDRD